ncbi:hypothetical protein FN976_02790 [Caenimonas sedimenti]|uniref:Uncharacterized protein n=1 Tax=Caenimonas sedimenti TaxID=2596921 RepID=A0A562ZX34_9BURK|nr:hypothetical protein [Caenimonas sedimenti]TWO73180.1 hypothetical protein FN976_02790 [Caenimonas sedimenti]
MNHFTRIALATFSLAVLPAAWAAGPSAAEQAYQKERAHCMSGKSHQDRATCLKEAGAARDEARRGALGSKSSGDLAGNATARCNAQPAADREACVQRILGAGSTSGSVEGGGVIRQTETKVP